MKDLTRYATSEPTTTMEAFADFLIAEVFGGALPDGVDEASFRTGVSLGGSTRGYFQASDSWKADARNYLANVEANAAKRAEESLAKAKAAKAKAEARESAAIAKLEAAVAAAKAKAAALAPESAEESADESAEVESLDATILPEESAEDAARAEVGAGPIVPATDAPDDESAESDAPSPATVGRRSRRAA